MTRRLVADDFHSLAARYDYTWLGDEEDIPTSIATTGWRCVGGHITARSYDTVKAKPGCSSCRSRITPQNAQCCQDCGEWKLADKFRSTDPQRKYRLKTCRQCENTKFYQQRKDYNRDWKQRNPESYKTSLERAKLKYKEDPFGCNHCGNKIARKDMNRSCKRCYVWQWLNNQYHYARSRNQLTPEYVTRYALLTSAAGRCDIANLPGGQDFPAAVLAYKLSPVSHPELRFRTDNMFWKAAPDAKAPPRRPRRRKDEREPVTTLNLLAG